MLLLAGIAWASCQLVVISNSTISEYVPATRERLCELVLGVSIFFAAAVSFRNQELLPWVFGAVAFNGVLITFFGLAQTVSDTDKLFWSYELIHGGKPFGPFVNGNNAGGYLIMSFAAANFFLALRLFRTIHRQSNAQVIQSHSTIQKIVHGLGYSFARTEPQLLYLLAALAITTAGVAASMSRGAMVALVVATLIGWGLLFRRNLAALTFSLVVIAAGIGLILWTQQQESIVSNLETLSEFQDASPNRLAHWEDSVAYGTAYAPFGSGLGTYSIMYKPFQETTFKRWFKFAENQYLETFAELGFPGLLILVATLFLGFCGCWLLLTKPDSMSRAVGFACLIALIGQSVAAVFDFGWFIPGNMFLFALMMGILCSQLNWSWASSRVSQKNDASFSLRFVQIATAILLLLTAWSAYEYSAVDARQACRKFYERFDPVRDRELVSDYHQLARYAVQIRPDDAQAHFHLALNHILKYRLAASNAMVQDVLNAQNEVQTQTPGKTNAVEIDDPQTEFTFEDAWQRSTLNALHRVTRAALLEDKLYFDELAESKPVRDHLVAAWNELKLAEDRLDKFWFVDIALAQLSLLMGHEEQEEAHIQSAIENSLNNSEVLYLAGILRHQSGNAAGAYSAWNQCLRQTREFEAAIVQFCRNEVGIREFFEQVLPSEPYFRLRIAKKFFGSDSDLLVKKLLLNHTKLKLDQHDLLESDRNFILGEIARLSQNDVVAIAYYRRALELNKHEVNWRIQLAKALVSAGMFEQAMTELKVCELYYGDHHLVCQRLIRQVKRLRIQKIKQSNGMK